MSALTFMKNPSHMLAAGFALSLAFSGSAFAMNAKDANAFLDTVQDGLKPYKLSMSHKDMNVEGESVTLTNVRLMHQSDAASMPIYLGTVHFVNIKPAKDGSYAVAEITTGDEADAAASADNKASRVTVSGAEISDAIISPKGKASSIADYLPYQKAAVKSAGYYVNGKLVLSLSNLSSQYAKKSDGVYRNSSKIGAFVYNFTAAQPGQESQDLKDMLSSLGYQNLRGHFEADGFWDSRKGEWEIGEYKLTAYNMGSLTLSGKFSGITQDFVNDYQKLAVEQVETANPTDVQQRQMNADSLALAQQVKMNNVTVTYKDDSLTGRVLDYLSKTTGRPREVLVSVLKSGIEANTQRIQDRLFAAHVNDQLGAFLTDPKSLQIVARPLQPVSVLSILQVSAILPGQLVDLLGLDIKANH